MWEQVGTLADLALIPQRVGQSPRYVTPDGSCTVYLRPFAAGTGWHSTSVAVLGDSLLAQVDKPVAMSAGAAGHGLVMGRLTTDHRVEIDAQPGRRWTAKPGGASPLEQADDTMLDELRGLREAQAVVAALGTNDAGWIAESPDEQTYELRLAWVLFHLGQILDELVSHGHCTVLTTIATRHKSYAGTAPGRFDRAAVRINELLRQRATNNPDDGLRLLDWGARADPHGTSDPQPWYGGDTIHLNGVGLPVYADALAAGAALC